MMFCSPSFPYVPPFQTFLKSLNSLGMHSYVCLTLSWLNALSYSSPRAVGPPRISIKSGLHFNVLGYMVEEDSQGSVGDLNEEPFPQKTSALGANCIIFHFYD